MANAWEPGDLEREVNDSGAADPVADLLEALEDHDNDALLVAAHDLLTTWPCPTRVVALTPERVKLLAELIYAYVPQGPSEADVGKRRLAGLRLALTECVQGLRVQARDVEEQLRGELEAVSWVRRHERHALLRDVLSKLEEVLRG